MAAFTSAGHRDCQADHSLDRDWLRLGQNEATHSHLATHDASALNSITALIAGPFAEAVGEIWFGDRTSDYLTASDARRHLWHAWLASGRAGFRSQNRLSADLVYTRLMRAKGPDLVAQAYPSEPRGLLAALGKLGATARRPQVYRALARALEVGGAGSKFIRHEPRLSDEVILGVAGLPSGSHARRVIDLLSTGKIRAEGLGFLAWAVSRLDRLKGAEAVRTVLTAPKPIDAAWDGILDCPFPDPPWTGNEHMVPVTSRARLREIADDFANCLTQRIRERQTVLDILNGHRFLFEWRGEERALLDFRRLGPIGWHLHEVRGPRNQAAAEATRDAIVDLLARIPLVCVVDLIDPLWGEDGTWAAVVF